MCEVHCFFRQCTYSFKQLEPGAEHNTEQAERARNKEKRAPRD